MIGDGTQPITESLSLDFQIETIFGLEVELNDLPCPVATSKLLAISVHS